MGSNLTEGLDLRALIGSYRGSGSASDHPEMLLGLLVYGYATGVFSSRKLERATYDSVAFRFTVPRLRTPISRANSSTLTKSSSICRWTGPRSTPAEAADKADVPDGMSIPQELAGREERLKKLAGRPAIGANEQPRPRHDWRGPAG